MHLNHLSAGRDPAVLVPLQQDAAQDAEGDALSGLPMYQTSIGSPGPRAPRIRLFEHVETFAREEKVRLSIQAPVPPYTNGFDFQASSPKTSGEGKCPVFQSTFTRPQRVVRHMRFRKSLPPIFSPHCSTPAVPSRTPVFSCTPAKEDRETLRSGPPWSRGSPWVDPATGDAGRADARRTQNAHYGLFGILKPPGRRIDLCCRPSTSRPSRTSFACVWISTMSPARWPSLFISCRQTGGSPCAGVLDGDLIELSATATEQSSRLFALPCLYGPSIALVLGGLQMLASCVPASATLA